MADTAADPVHAVLEILGDGGTTDMARRVLAWLAAGADGLGVQPRNIAGLAEVAAVVRRPRATISGWRRAGDVSFPEPFLTLGCGPLWDLEQVRRWMAGNPDLVGDETPPA